VNPLWNNIFHKKLEEESIAYFLGSVSIFSDLGKRGRLQLESLMHLRTYKADEIIFETGDPGSGMYVIRSGAVQIFNRSAKNGDIELARLGQKGFFGETTLAAPSKRTASARALEPTVLIGLFRADINELAKRNPSIAYKILLSLSRVVSERLHFADRSLTNLRQQHPELFTGESS
jgi:CRP/FNR family cyclic AMP-dependent transcriptional regulator